MRKSRACRPNVSSHVNVNVTGIVVHWTAKRCASGIQQVYLLSRNGKTLTFCTVPSRLQRHGSFSSHLDQWITACKSRSRTATKLFQKWTDKLTTHPDHKNNTRLVKSPLLHYLSHWLHSSSLSHNGFYHRNRTETVKIQLTHHVFYHIAKLK